MKEQRAVPPALANLALDALIRQLFETSWGKARGWIESGKVSVNGRVVRELRATVPSSAVIELNMNAPRTGGAPGKFALGSDKSSAARDIEIGGGLGDGQASGDASTREYGRVGSHPSSGLASLSFDRKRVVYVDTQIIVVNKPTGISSVPYDAQEKGTLQDLVSAYLGRARLEVVHRIDKETSGLLVFARTREAAHGLANQFRFHTVHRRYLAIAQGRVSSGTIRSTLIADRGDGLRGTAPPHWRVAPGEGQAAVTHVRAIEPAADATLIECRLETGRTHQIRIHLSEKGHPLLGEKLYVRDFTHELLPAPRVMLHATELGFRHPVSGAQMKWEQEPPVDFQMTWNDLKRRKLHRSLD